MSLKTVLRQLSENMQVWSDKGLNEAQTSQVIVLPVLQALSYNIFDPYEVVPQSDTQVYRPDFTVNFADKIRFVIEVKTLNKDFINKDQTQSVNYVNAEGRRWAVLTNGKAWHFFDNQIPKPAAEKLATTVDIQKPEAANYLTKLLARSVWESADADDVVARRVDEVAEDIRKRTKLSEIAAKLEHQLAEGFTQDEVGLKKAIQLTLEPNEKELALESIVELSRKLLGVSEYTSIPASDAISKGTASLVAALKSGIALTKPMKKKGTPSDIKVWIDGEEVDASSWRDIHSGVAEALIILGEKSILESTGLVSDDMQKRKASGDVYPPSAYRQLSDGTYLFLHAGATDHAKRCRKMLKLVGAPVQTVRVIYKSEEFGLP